MKNCVTEVAVNAVPRPQGPMSVGMRHDNLVFLSGQLGKDPRSGEFAADFEEQTRRVLQNLKNILEEAGGSMQEVLKVTAFITDIANLPMMNRIYGEFFVAPYPARSTVEVSALAAGALVEMDLVAALPDR